MTRDKCNIIVCIQNKNCDYSFVGNAAKDKYMRDFYRQIHDSIDVIGFYCNDDFVKIICMDTDGEALSGAVRKTNMLYGSYYKRVMGGKRFTPAVDVTYAYSEEELREKYCEVMCGRTGEPFYADYTWSSIAVLSGSNTTEYLFHMLNPMKIRMLFGEMYLHNIIVRTINMKSLEDNVDKNDAIARNVIWKMTQFRDETDFRRRADVKEKALVAQTLYYVHRFSYMQIARTFNCSKSTVYRYLREIKTEFTREI